MSDLVQTLPVPVVLAAIVGVLVVEAGLLIGVFVPGTACTLAAGALAALGVLPLPAVLGCTVLGAVAGGQVGYWRGRRQRREPAPVACVTRFVQWSRLRAMLTDRPRTVVASGQWLSWCRMLVPRCAGWAGVQHLRFSLAQGASATSWASTLTVVGYTGSAAVRQHVAHGLGLVAALAGLVVGATLLVLRTRARRSATCRTVRAR